MNYFLALLGAGIAVGALYGLMATGFALVFKATRVVNFAQGEMMMLIAYLSFSVSSYTGLTFWSLVPIVLIISILTGLLIEFIFIRPMIGQPVFSTVMITVGLAVMLKALIILIWGADPIVFPARLEDVVVTIGSIRLFQAQLLSIVIFLICLFLTFGFFKFSRLGIAMRAASNNETAALLMGINVKAIYALAWSLSAVMAGITGLMISTIYDITPDMFSYGLRAFPATILGGLDAVIGSAIAGIVIGVLENIGEGYVGRGMKEVFGFIVIILVLMVRPYGFFGTKKIERV